MANPKIQTPAEFARNVEVLVYKHRIPYMEAVVLYCEQNGLEIETAASLIKMNSSVKEKIQIEGENLNMLPKVNRLPGT